MTTSGTTTTEMNRDGFVAAAMRTCGELASGQTPSVQDIADFGEMLNNLVAELQTMGMPLWAKLETTIPMVAGTQSYTIGVGQTVNQAFPLKIYQAWLDNVGGGSKQNLYPNAIYDFNMLPSSSSGTPSQYTYRPSINMGQLRLWPIPDATAVANKTLTISYLAPFEDFQSAADTPYFPREWNNTIIFGLAYLIAPSVGVPLNDQGNLKKRYDDHLELALDFGLEQASITFAPERR